MEVALVFAETVFYSTVSLAIITIGTFCVIVMYHLIRIVRELEEFSRNLKSASSDAGERINDIIDGISDLPILSYFLKKRSVLRERKGREKSSNKTEIKK